MQNKGKLCCYSFYECVLEECCGDLFPMTFEIKTHFTVCDCINEMCEENLGCRILLFLYFLGCWCCINNVSQIISDRQQPKINTKKIYINKIKTRVVTRTVKKNVTRKVSKQHFNLIKILYITKALFLLLFLSYTYFHPLPFPLFEPLGLVYL